jgi:hypothetical protein
MRIPRRIEPFEVSCERAPNGTSVCPEAGVLEDPMVVPDVRHECPVLRRARSWLSGHEDLFPGSTERWMSLHPTSQYHRRQPS